MDPEDLHTLTQTRNVRPAQLFGVSWYASVPGHWFREDRELARTRAPTGDWRLFLLRGVLSNALGVVAILLPAAPLLSLVILLSAYMLMTVPLGGRTAAIMPIAGWVRQGLSAFCIGPAGCVKDGAGLSSSLLLSHLGSLTSIFPDRELAQDAARERT